MKTRHVLAVDPQGHLINQSLQITAYDQAFHRVESVVAAKKALSKYYCSVGLVVFDSLTPAFQDDIELLIAASARPSGLQLFRQKCWRRRHFSHSY